MTREKGTATAKPTLDRVRYPASTERLFQRADPETPQHRGGQEQPTPNSTRIGAAKRLEDQPRMQARIPIPEGHVHTTTQVPYANLLRGRLHNRSGVHQKPTNAASEVRTETMRSRSQTPATKSWTETTRTCFPKLRAFYRNRHPKQRESNKKIDNPETHTTLDIKSLPDNATLRETIQTLHQRLPHSSTILHHHMANVNFQRVRKLQHHSNALRFHTSSHNSST